MSLIYPVEERHVLGILRANARGGVATRDVTRHFPAG